MKHQEPPKEEIEIETLYYNVDETCSAVVPDFEAIPAGDVAAVAAVAAGNAAGAIILNAVSREESR